MATRPGIEVRSWSRFPHWLPLLVRAGSRQATSRISSSSPAMLVNSCSPQCAHRLLLVEHLLLEPYSPLLPRRKAPLWH